MNPKLLRIVTSAESYGLIKGQLRFLSDNGWRVVGVSGGSEETARATEQLEDIRTIIIPNLVRPISLRDDVKALLQLIKVVREEKPLIVHANTPKGSLLGMVAAWWCRVPHRIYTVTGLRFETATGLFRWLLVTMERITCVCATKVIPEGDGVAETLRRNKITRKPLKKILNGNINGIDLSHFSMTDEVARETEVIREKIGGSHRFVFVGRIVRDKGISELVTAFKRFQKQYPDARLILVGTMEPELDPLPNDILDEIRDNNSIIETGWQTDVRPWIAAADALLLPSYREGFPNVVMQAGAMGLPSIVTDINGCNEIIIEGENGYIVPTHDADVLYQRMLLLVENRERTKRMAKNARPLIESRYEQKGIWKATQEMYDNLIELRYHL